VWVRTDVWSSCRTASPKARPRRRSTRPYSCALGGAAPASERTLCRAALLLGRTRLRRFRRLDLHRSLLLLVLVLLTLVTHHAVLSQCPIRGAAIGRGRVVCGFERIVRICMSVYLRSIDPVRIGPVRHRSLRVLSVPSCLGAGAVYDDAFYRLSSRRLLHRWRLRRRASRCSRATRHGDMTDNLEERSMTSAVARACRVRASAAA